MVTPSVREQFLVLSVLGKDPMDLAHLLCRTSLESRCVMDMARLTRHGEYSALVLQVSGSWDALARMESAVTSLAKKHNLQVSLTRSSPLDDRPMALPYVAYVSAVYRPDIVSELCQFFASHRIELEQMNCDTYLAPQTGGLMLNATLTLILPAGIQINWLRDQFLDFADALNLDALIEPWRPQTP